MDIRKGGNLRLVHIMGCLTCLVNLGVLLILCKASRFIKVEELGTNIRHGSIVFKLVWWNKGLFTALNMVVSN